MPEPAITSGPGVVDIFVARQPIFDAKGGVRGYELLYRRNGVVTHADGDTAEAMAAEVLVHSFLNIGLDKMTGGARAWLNFTREMLLRGVYQLFPPRAVVIELLESVEPDDEVVAACDAMVAAGYQLALDDFVYAPAFEPLLAMATTVKLDVLGKRPEDLISVAATLQRPHLQLLAERVETEETRTLCQSLGFTLFQGYYFSRPEVLTKRDLSSAQVAILRLMNQLRDAGAPDTALEDSFRTDVSLTYKLLRAVNSAAAGGRGIESIRHAVRLVGRDELHKWLALLLVTSVANGSGTSEELVHTAIRRARMCELIAMDRGDRRGSEALFMVGLFSLLDAMLKMPMAELLEQIDLAPEVRRALLIRSGPFAPTLALVEAYERGAWDTATGEADLLDLPAQKVGELYLDALVWARDQLNQASV